MINDFDRTPSKIKCRDIENRGLLKAITSYMEQTQETFTWANIRDHLINREGIRDGRDIIRKILIDKFHYSFKRWSPRPLNMIGGFLNSKRFCLLWKYARYFISLPYLSTLMSLHSLNQQSQTIHGVGEGNLQISLLSFLKDPSVL